MEARKRGQGESDITGGCRLTQGPPRPALSSHARQLRCGLVRPDWVAFPYEGLHQLVRRDERTPLELFGAITAVVTFMSSGLLLTLLISVSGISRLRYDCLRALAERAEDLEGRLPSLGHVVAWNLISMLRGSPRNKDYDWRRTIITRAKATMHFEQRRSLAESVSLLAAREGSRNYNSVELPLLEVGESVGAEAAAPLLMQIQEARSIDELRLVKRQLTRIALRVLISQMRSKTIRETYTVPIARHYVDTVGRWSAGGFILGNILWMMPPKTGSWPKWIGTSATIGSSVGAVWYAHILLLALFATSEAWRDLTLPRRVLLTCIFLILSTIAMLAGAGILDPLFD